MGLVYAEIELINAEDLALAKKHYIGEEEIKRMWVTGLVDTGSYMLCINESIQAQMQFPVMEKRIGQMANGDRIECDVVSQVEVRFKNRRTICNAMILPGDSEVLIGAIPLKDMDVLIHRNVGPPLRQELIVNPEHPYFARGRPVR
ncbi:MAG: retropepsin-like domain-containing protein [Spirosomaceae bacterium]|jgi:clan AA aspartic protease|nr:retropepsin-like domain-containing protein [Spirosomataceae bacterium]